MSATRNARTILVVDDDRDMVDTLCDILELRGWQVVRAYDGEEAVRLAASEIPDWILMDNRMPRLTGVEALAAIREFSPQVRAVLMTAFASHDLPQRAEGAGITRILHKPFEPADLFSLLDEAA
jgi:two-component system NtrC family response regulator/two-component system nitrogen regulation response regulator GlnG